MKIIDVKKTKENYELTIDVDNNLWKNQQEKIAKNLASNIKVDGYRKGKVPYEVAIKRIPKSEIITRSVDKILQTFSKDIINSEEFKKIEDDILDLPPTVNISKIDDNNLQLVFSYVVYPEVSVDGYKDIKISSTLKNPSDQDVQVEIDKYLSRHSLTVPKESGSIINGDVVTFDFTGYIDGKQFEGGTSKNYTLTIGSGQFIPGFEEQMIGMNINDKKTINVIFPNEYHEKSIAGKPAKFEVEVHSISKIEKPNLDDAFVKTLNIKDVNDVNEFKNFIKNKLIESNKETFEREKKQEIYRAILDIVKISNIPDELIAKEKEKLTKSTEQQISVYGLKLDQYLKMLGIDKEKFEEQQLEAAKQNLKISMAILKICELEKIEATEQELQDELEKQAKIYNMKKEDILKNINNDLSIFESFVIERKVNDFFSNKK